MNQGKCLTGGCGSVRMWLSSNRSLNSVCKPPRARLWLLDTPTWVRGGVALGKESR